MSSCLDCSWFAGRDRDRQATLFRIGKGYCNNPEHPWGIWNVVQDVTSKRGCSLFEEAPENIRNQRKEAALRLMKEAKRGEKSANKGRRW